MLKDLTYNVIIIDDEVDLYEDYTEIIEKKLSTEGYILTHERWEELSELDNYPLDEVDLFLVDLKFGKEDKGPEFIKKIREHQLTDILFYSSDAEAIQSYRKSGAFQGVFFAIRDENTDEINDMINHLTDKMIKRSNTPLSSRGIVLGSVAEIDNIIKSKVSLLLSKVTPEQKSKIVIECYKLYYDSYKGNSNRINQFFGCDFHKGMKSWTDAKSECKDFSLPDLVNYVGITDSNKNLRILLKTYKTLMGEDDTYKAIKNFNDLLSDRNIFAHVREEKNADGNYQLKRLNSDGHLVLTNDKCRELRNSIVIYFNAINNLLEE